MVAANVFVCGLNPCFCGTYFSSPGYGTGKGAEHGVLILVFVELTFRDGWDGDSPSHHEVGLNPCFCGTYFSSKLRSIASITV